MSVAIGATKRDEGLVRREELRLSMEMPLTAVRFPAELLPRTAFSISPKVHNGSAKFRLLLQYGAHRIVVRIGNDGAFDDLSSLMAFARNQQDIA